MKERVYVFLTGFVIFVLAAAATRMMTSAFGSSAATTIAIGFSILLGLTLGTYYFSSRFEGTGSKSRALGLVQLAAALCLLILITVLPGMHRAYAFLHSLGPSSPDALLTVRVILTVAVLIVPGFLLGGAFAFIALMGTAGSRRRMGDIAGTLFLGLAVSVPLVTLLLLPYLGVSLTLAIGAIVSAAMSGLSLLAGIGPRETSAGPAQGSPSARLQVATGVFLISFSVISQIFLYARVLTQVTGTNAYTLVAGSTVVMLGLWLGSSVLARPMYRIESGLFSVGLLAAIGTIYTLSVAGSVDSLPVLFLKYIDYGKATTTTFAATYFFISALPLFVPAILMGMAIGGTASRSAPGGGRAEAGNLRTVILPAAVGALLAYPLALPVIQAVMGLESGILFVAWLSLAGGALLMAASRTGRMRLVAVISAAVVALVLTLTHSPWNIAAITSGVYVNPHLYANLEEPGNAIRNADIVYYSEDLEGIVSVVRTPDGTFLKVNGKVGGAASEKTAPEIMAAHIPMMVHENPRNVLLLGLGTGITLGSLQRYDTGAITAVEPSEAVIDAAHLFARESYNALEDRRTTIEKSCARGFMRLADEKYDVIVSRQCEQIDPLHGSASTVDFMLLVRSVLAYDGVFCYVLEPRDFSRECAMTTVNTLLAAFPYVTAWYGGATEILLLGAMEPFALSVRGLKAKLERPWVSNDLKRLQINDENGVISNLMMDRELLRAYLGAFSRLNTDRRPSLACDAVPVHTPGETATILSDFNRFRLNPVDLLIDYEEDSIDYKLARDLYGRCRDAGNYYVGSYLALGSGNQQEAARRLEYAVSLCSANGLVKHRLSYLYIYISRDLAGGGRFDEAVNVARRAVEVSPYNYLTYFNLAVLERTRDRETAIALLERLRQINPEYVPADILRAELLLESGRVADASEAISEVLSREPMNLRAHHVRGICFVERGLTEAARVELEFVIEADPENVEALAALGYTWLLVGDIGGAEKYYERAFRIDPDNLGVLNNYATIFAEKGDYREAIVIWQKALKLDPTNAGIKANIQEANQKLRED